MIAALLLTVALAVPRVDAAPDPVAGRTPARVHLADEAVPTLITDVAVLQVDGTVGARRDVILREGRIEAVLPVGQGWSAGATEVVDGAGATLLPGLIDAHVHLGSTMAVPGRLRIPRPRRNAEALLAAGVTTALDLALPVDQIARLHARVQAGRLAGPDLRWSGRPFAAPGGHPRASVRAAYPGPLVALATRHIALEVDTRDEVDAAFARRPRTGFVKVMLDSLPPGAPTLSDEALARLRVAATALDERLIAHVGRPEDVDRALAAPVDALAHLPSHGALSGEQVDAIAAAGLPVIPTFAAWDAFGGVAAGALPAWPLAEELLTRRQRRGLARVEAGRAPLRPGLAEAGATTRDAAPTRLDNARRLHEAGATVLVGSDAPNLALPAGAGTHYELDRLREAGLSGAAVLAAATWHNSRFVDPDARFGAIRPGWEADLVLIDGDPAADWQAVHRIREVWTDGRRVERRGRR